MFTVPLKEIKKGFGRFFRQPTAKPLKYQSNKPSRVGGKRDKGVKPVLHANTLNQAWHLNHARRLFQLYNPWGKNRPEVSFVKVSHACLVIFTVRYNTGNLPLKSECWYRPYHLPCVWPRQHFHGLWQRLQQAVISLITKGKDWVLSPPSWIVIVKTWQGSKSFVLKIRLVAGLLPTT